jgi:uncharacterized protein (DUF362 family)
MAKVSVVGTKPLPDLESICEYLQKSIDLIGGLASFVEKGSKILLKPNAGTASTPDEARNTDPRVIEAMIVLLKQVGAHKIFVAESSLVGVDTMAAFKSMGIDKIASRQRAAVVDLKKRPFVARKVPDPLVLPSIRVSAMIDEVDAVINLPKLKTIASLPVSLGMKNLKGLLPDSEKKRFHRTHLARAIVDLNRIVKPTLTVIDGIVACELYEPRETDVLFAGMDVLALETVTMSAVGVNPEKIEYISLADRAGVGVAEPGRIEVLGDPLDRARLDLKKAPTSSEAFKRLFPEVRFVDGESCSGCIGALYMGLTRARKKGLLDKIPDLSVAMGAKIEKLPPGEKVLCAGNCTEGLGAEYYLPGCPFITTDLTDFLEEHFVED